MTQLGVAVWLYERKVSVGFGAKAYSHALGDATAGGYSADIGLYWRSTPWLDLAFVGRDAVSRITWSSGVNESLPLDWRVGARIHLWSERLGLSLDIQNNTAQAPKVRGGLEVWSQKKILASRLGWDGQEMAGGIGLRLPLWGLDGGLDYTMSGDPIGGGALQHRFSLTLGIPL